MFSTLTRISLFLISTLLLWWGGTALAVPNGEIIPQGESSVQQLALGMNHTCAITANGGVKCWGSNFYGILGDGRNEGDRFIPIDVVGLTRHVRVISAGFSTSCAVMDDNSVQCWGDDPSNLPHQVKGLPPIQSVSVGAFHICALTTAGEVYCWGQNGSGQLGNGSTEDSSEPVAVVGLHDATMISAGLRHTCALRSEGGVQCWGDNAQGQLGDGSTTSASTPVDVAGLSVGVQAVSAGQQHTCALMTDGTVQCWGDNMFGQLGDGTTTMRPLPGLVPGLEGIVQLDSHNTNHVCTLTNTGQVMCWGANRFGQVGDGSFSNRTNPTHVENLPESIRSVNVGGTHTCALTSEGDVICWGANNFGQSGKNPGWAPVDVLGLAANVKSIDIDYDHACAIADGGVKCWGNNGFGQLGDGTRTTRFKPTDVVGLNNGVKTVDLGYLFTCALTESGEVKCWGQNAGINSLVPVDAPGMLKHIKGLAVGEAHVCVLTQGNGVKCWGSNRFGQLGDGTTTSRNAPVDVIGLESGVQAITAGMSHTCALMQNGHVKCWGRNASGQLGDDTTIDRTQPVDVVGLSAVKSITAGGAHTCAITRQGALKCWGANTSGQLGNGTDMGSARPVDVGGMASGVQFVDAGAEHTCAITRWGRAQCWGENLNFGQLGNGTTGRRFVPEDVIWLQPDNIAISAGLNNSCVITRLGAAKCWGDTSYGKLGDDGALWKRAAQPAMIEGDLSSTQLIYLPQQIIGP